MMERMMVDAPPARENVREELMAGFLAGLPICLGYIPLGLTLGVLGQKAGLSPFEMGLMSFFVFAGSSQFIAVAMLMQAASPLSIIMTTFVVNLRHLLMSSSLALFLKGESRPTLTAFAHTITDESFVINSERFSQGTWTTRKAMMVSYTAYAAWFLSTVTGAFTGQFIEENAFGMDYAMTAMFICLLVLQLNAGIHVITGILSGVIAVFAALYIPGNWYIIIGAVSAATLGCLLRKCPAPTQSKDM